MAENKKEFKGIVARPFTIVGKKADKDGKNGTPDKKYETGDSFVTKSEEFFQSLINKKRIKQ